MFLFHYLLATVPPTKTAIFLVTKQKSVEAKDIRLRGRRRLVAIKQINLLQRWLLSILGFDEALH